MNDQAHDDALGLALSVISAEDRRRFGEITAALLDAADAAAQTPHWTVRPPADALRELAAHYRAQGDPVWPALSAAAARVTVLGNID